MAKVKLPLLSGQVSGSVGDITFISRHGKTFARRRSAPTNRNTVKQQAIRTNFKALSDAFLMKADTVILKKYNPATMQYDDVEFDKLTADEVKAWEEYTVKKGKYRSLARNIFIAENQKLLRMGENPKRVP